MKRAKPKNQAASWLDESLKFEPVADSPTADTPEQVLYDVQEDEIIVCGFSVAIGHRWYMPERYHWLGAL